MEPFLILFLVALVLLVGVLVAWLLAKRQVQSLQADLQQTQQEQQTLLAEKIRAEERLSALQLSQKALQEKEEQLQTALKTSFSQMAADILEDKSVKFTQLNKQEMDQLLQPLDKSIQEFKQTVQQNLTEETKQRSSLEEQVRNLVTQTNSVSDQANQLASALRGKNKIQGNWGEMILESVLQKAGLEEGLNYEKQKSVHAEEGNLLIPDMIIHLPSDRDIIVDSKVSLVDYERYSSALVPEEQEAHLQAHIKSVKKHIDELAEKTYPAHFASAADFTMLFIPIEPAYMAALQKDGDLWQYAYKKKIMLVSPSNLLPCVKLIDDLWRREQQSKNAQEIVKQGQNLYDKLATFYESFLEARKALDKATDTMDKAEKQLKSGRGNLFSRAENLKRLGVSPTKQLPLSEGGNNALEEGSTEAPIAE